MYTICVYRTDLVLIFCIYQLLLQLAIKLAIVVPIELPIGTDLLLIVLPIKIGLLYCLLVPT